LKVTSNAGILPSGLHASIGVEWCVEQYRERHPTLTPGLRTLRLDLLVAPAGGGDIRVFAAGTIVDGPFDIEAGDSIGLLSGGKAYTCHVDDFVDSAGVVPDRQGSPGDGST